MKTIFRRLPIRQRGHFRPANWLFLGSVIPVCLLLSAWFAPAAHAQTAPVCTLDISDAVAVLLTVPADTALGEAFGLGFTVPISAYLCAYLVGQLVAMFNSR